MRLFLVVLVASMWAALSAAVHAVAHAWLRRAAPGLVAVRPRAVRAVFVALWATGFLRYPIRLAFGLDAAAWSTAIAGGWVVMLGLAMLPIAIVDALRRARARIAPRAAKPDAPEDASRRAAIERVAGTALVAGSSAVLGWGVVRGRVDWHVEEVPIRVARLPRALDGYTIVQISNLHVGTFMSDRDLARGLEVAQRARGDLVAITGDIVDVDPAYVATAARFLGKLTARDGVACVPGNHDYYTGVDRVLDALSRAGLDVLLNRARRLQGSGLWIAGADDLHGATAVFRHGPPVDRVLAGVPADDAIVLLAHQPPYIDEARGRVDVQLSGHTHGGQINPGFSPVGMVLPWVRGLYEPDPRTRLYVNRGFGTVGPPARIGAPPEVTRIVLVAG